MRTRHDQALRGEAQARPPHGPEHLGPPEEPRQPPRIRPRPARPAPQGQALRLRRAAARQAEAQGLLRQHLRKAVPRHLCGGDPPEGRLRPAPDRPPGAAARRRGLPREVRADAVRRAPVRQPRPRQGERPPGQHPELPAQGRRRHRGQGQVEQLAMVLEATGLAERDVPDYIEVDHNKITAKLARIPRSPRCPTRCRWSRTWWWNSTRAERSSRNQVWPTRSPGGILYAQDLATATPWT